MLHAWKLALDHPGDGRRLVFNAPIPPAYREILAKVGIPIPVPEI
jgi:hypothetical protein